MKNTCTDLIQRVNGIEDEFTQTLGFVLPNSLTKDEVQQLLTVIKEPLRSDIQRELLTTVYYQDDYDMRWAVLNRIIRFGMRFGNMKTIPISLANEFESLLNQTAERLHTLLNTPEKVPASRYTYLRGVTYGLIKGIDEYEPAKLKFVSKENFIVLNSKECDSYYSNLKKGVSETFDSLSDVILTKNKSFNNAVGGYEGVPYIVRDLYYLDGADTLKKFKSNFIAKIELIRLYNEILDTFN